ncbi:MAG: HAMP domain-containing histidine kinase, partial [Burkholderiales bacterium]|nr:HAMP domain-containing histidine kinase [Anaerolineae bacterium]
LEADALLSDMRRQLHEARLHVQRLDKSKSDFIAVAAHELKTPLTVIEGYTGIMLNDASLTTTVPQVLPILEGIDGGVKRLREIIADIIDVSLIELDMLQLRFQPVWLQQLLDGLENSLRGLMERRSLEFVIQRDMIPASPTYADPERLLQVLQKVIMNAMKYTPDGGIIVISSRELPGFTDLTVTDTGIGIDPANLGRIFDTFSALGDVSLHSSGKTKFKGGGPGLGLPIAKGMIEAHGGTIWAQSPGFDEKTCPGSTFHIMIPMRDGPPNELTADPFD